MTKQKVQKRAVRERMAKTGERYTTARHYLLDLHHLDSAPDLDQAEPAPGTAETATSTPPEPPNEAVSGEASGALESRPPAWVEQPGMSEDALFRTTGKTWAEWFALLDAWGAAERTHTEIARHVYETYAIDGWWAQGVTVGYERARGLRQRHQRPDGFSVNASKTVAAPLGRLYAALLDESLRDQWLEPGSLRMRTSQPERSARFDVVASGTLLTANFIAKGETKATVQLQELKLPTADEVEPRKAFWQARLNRLAALLTAEPAGQ